MKTLKKFNKFVNEELEISNGAGRYKFLLSHLSELRNNRLKAPTEAAEAEYLKDIRNTEAEIKAIEQKGNVNFRKTESVGEYEDSFVKINIDETDLEVSEKPEGKLKQKSGKIIIETPSKTDAYNAKMRLGGDVIVDPEFPEKQIHHVKSVKESLINEISPEVKKEVEDLGIKLEGGMQGNLVILTFRPGDGQIRFLMDKNGQFYKHGLELYATSASQLGTQERQNLQTAINKIKAHFQTV